MSYLSKFKGTPFLLSIFLGLVFSKMRKELNIF